MLRDDAAVATLTGDDLGTSDDLGDPGGGRETIPRAFRKKMPFGRGAVLVVGDRSHIVGIADLSVSGAYLRTRLPVRIGDEHILKLFLLPERAEMRLRARVVRVSVDRDESHNHPRGVAVQFVDPSPGALARLQTYLGVRSSTS
jgi:Tfp pilus assembly protein PilZ